MTWRPSWPATGFRSILLPLRKNTLFLPHTVRTRAAPGSEHFEFIRSLGPVFTQEPRQRTVGQQSPAGLARGAVVRLIGGVADALDFRAATRAELFIAAVNRHALPERGDSFGKALSGLLAKTRDPSHESGARG